MPFQSSLRLLALLAAAALLAVGTACDSGPQPPEEEQCEPASFEGGPTLSTDRWTLLGLDGPQISDIESIAINPCDPQVLLAGSAFDFSGGIPGKLFRSPDGGQTWDTVDVAGVSFNDVRFMPSNPELAYAAGGDVRKSTDGGASWSIATEEIDFTRLFKALSLAVAPDRPQTVYAGTGGFSADGGVTKSTDGGETWRWLEGFEKRNSIGSLAISPRNSEVVYAGVTGGTILKTTDGGASWRSVFSRPPDVSAVIVAIVFATQAGEHLYVSARSDGIFESKDGGKTWQRPGPLPDSVELVSDLAVPPGRDELYAATTEGVYRKKGTGGWEPLNEGLVHTRVRRLAISPDGERIYAGLDWTSPEGTGLYVRALQH